MSHDILSLEVCNSTFIFVKEGKENPNNNNNNNTIQGSTIRVARWPGATKTQCRVSKYNNPLGHQHFTN